MAVATAADVATSPEPTVSTLVAVAVAADAAAN